MAAHGQTKRIYEAPTLTITDVWENRVTFTITQPGMGLHSRPERWDIGLYNGHKLIQSLLLPVTALVEAVRVDRGLEAVHELVVTVRGTSSNGTGKEATIAQKLLPQPSIRQYQVLPDALHLHWYFADWSSPIPQLVSRFEVAIAGEEYASTETCQEFVCGYDTGDASLQGNAVIRLAPHLLRGSPNFAVYGRVRCYSHHNHVWGQWSPRVRLMCLSPLNVEVRNVTSTSMTFLWGRNRSEGSAQLHEEDVGVERFEVVAWPARLAAAVHLAGEVATPPRSVVTGQTHVFGPNVSTLDGLLPDVVYNVCTRWRQVCGGDWHKRYFRVATKPEPEIVGIPRIGHTFVDIQWAPKGSVGQRGTRRAPSTDLTDYIDDSFDAGDEHSPSFTLVGPASMRSDGLDLHRITVTVGLDVVKTIDVRHNPESRVQRCRVSALPPGTTLRVSVRTASYFGLDGTDHWSWGTSSEIKLVTTVSDLRVVPQERGPNYMILELRCDPVDPVRRLEGGSLFASEDEGIRASFVTPKGGVYAAEPLGEGEVVVESLPGEGDTLWGHQGHRDSLSLTSVRLDAPARVQLTLLKANWTYRFSINVIDVDGEWWGRQSIVFTTSAEDIFYVRPYVSAGPEQSLRIDQNYHDRQFGERSDLNIRYPVVIGEGRLRELSDCTAFLPSRLTSIPLRARVSSLGSDHCIVDWEAFVIHDSEAGCAAVHYDTMRRAAAAFNTAHFALHEYRMKIFVNILESTRLADQAVGGVTDTTRELYFRSAVKTAKLVGLMEGYKYRIALSYYNVASQKWSPWSELLVVRPADRLVMSAARIGGSGVLLKWKRLIMPPVDRVPNQTIAPIHYEVMVQVPGRATELHTVPNPEYEHKDLSPGVNEVSARSWYDTDSCGPFSDPCCIAVTPLKISCGDVTQSTAALTWDLPNLVPRAGARGRVIINVNSMGREGANTHTTIDIGPFDTSYTLKQLVPAKGYTVSALQLLEVASSTAGHTFDDVDPSTFTTLGDLSVEVVERGEDYAVIRWGRRPMVGSSVDPSDITSSVNLGSPIRPPTAGQRKSIVAGGSPEWGKASCRTSMGTPGRLRAVVQERYELVVEDHDYGHTERHLVPCGKPLVPFIEHRLVGLLPNGRYRVRVRIDSEASFFSPDVVFRTPGPLVVRLRRLPGGDKAVLECIHPLLSVTDTPGDEADTVEWVSVPTPVEIRVNEMPKAPPRRLTGSKAALELFKTRQSYQRRATLKAGCNVWELTQLPPEGAVLHLSARQQSGSRIGFAEEWRSWVHTDVTL